MFRYIILVLLIPIVAVGVAIIAVFRNMRKGTKRSNKDVAYISHSEAIRKLPEYKRARKAYHLLAGVSILLLTACVVLSAIIAARPIKISVRRDQANNRDVMFCLDTSGSMSEAIPGILNDFARLTRELNGQRLGITVFDGNAAQILPLSSDYNLIADTLEDIASNPQEYNQSTRAGASSGYRSSMIGEGVISCVNNLTSGDKSARSRSVILATDNYAGGDISLTQAVNYAKQSNITFYGIADSSYYFTYSKATKEFEAAMLSTGGLFYQPADKNIDVSTIANRIMEQEAAVNETTPRIVRIDGPELAIFICLITTIAYLFMTWSLRI